MRRSLLVAFVLASAAALAGCGKAAPEPFEPVKDDPIASVDRMIAALHPNTTQAGWRTRLPRPQQVPFPQGKKVFWTLTTNKGRMVVELWHDVAPMHVSNLIYLTRLKFYDGLTFHRVIRGFMAQGGCPLGTGAGMPGYGIPLEVSMSAKHDRIGILSTANTGRPNTDGSQFFLTFRRTPELDGGYTAYGHLVEGLEVLQAMEAVGSMPGARNPAPRERLVIEKATVELR